MTPHAASVEVPAASVLPSSVFVERESLELKQLQAFLESESPSCEVVMASEVGQAVVLAGRRRARARVVVIHGGLADGRAHAFVARLREQQGAVDLVAFVDRRHCRGPLDEPRLEELQPRLRGALADGWLFVRFLDRK
jgi:hypothetical protein